MVAETVTGPGGAFAFEGIAPGEYVPGVRRTGFAAYSVPLEVGAEGPTPLDVRLSLDPVEVEPLNVDVEGRPLRLVETGFYDRLEEGWGTYFKPEWVSTRRGGFIRLSHFVSNLQMRAPPSRCPTVLSCGRWDWSPGNARSRGNVRRVRRRCAPRPSVRSPPRPSRCRCPR